MVSKLTEQDRIDIFDLFYKRNHSMMLLAQIYDVGYHTISNVISTKMKGYKVEHYLFFRFDLNVWYNLHDEFKDKDKIKAIEAIDLNEFPGYKIEFDKFCRNFRKIKI